MDAHSTNTILLGMAGLNKHVDRKTDGLEEMHLCLNRNDDNKLITLRVCIEALFVEIHLPESRDMEPNPTD